MSEARTVHVLALPHTETTRDYSWCAYTQKVRHFANMLHDSGHRVVLYGGTRNEARCAEHVEVLDDEDREAWFGDMDFTRVAFGGWNASEPWWQITNERIVRLVRERCAPGDVLGLIAGTCQQQVADALPQLLPVEWGIGYEGVFAPFRVYESAAWMHYLYGRDKLDGRFYDTVIPNAFDPGEFHMRREHDDYLLFMARHTPRKGTEVVAEIAKRHHVVCAGQAQEHERIPGTDYVGVVGPSERARLLAGARALLAPTLYVEPFGGVVVEAALSGTPAITTPWGAFAETVEHGSTGFHCRTLRQFLNACDLADKLDRSYMHERAVERYSTKAVAPLYDRFLAQLDTLHGDGWYQL